MVPNSCKGVTSKFLVSKELGSSLMRLSLPVPLGRIVFRASAYPRRRMENRGLTRIPRPTTTLSDDLRKCLRSFMFPPHKFLGRCSYRLPPDHNLLVRGASFRISVPRSKSLLYDVDPLQMRSWWISLLQSVCRMTISATGLRQSWAAGLRSPMPWMPEWIWTYRSASSVSRTPPFPQGGPGM